MCVSILQLKYAGLPSEMESVWVTGPSGESRGSVRTRMFIKRARPQKLSEKGHRNGVYDRIKNMIEKADLKFVHYQASDNFKP